MNLNALRQFVAVATELHFGRAAERLHVAQPALSRAIRQLESELGTRLLDRSRRHVALTPAGHSFLEHARRAVENADHAVLAAKRVSTGDIGRLNLSYSSAAILDLVPRAVAAFRKRFPDVEVALREQTFSDQIQALRDGRIDVGIFPYRNVVGQGLSFERLRRESLVAAVPSNHPLSRRRSIRFAELSAQPMVRMLESEGPSAHAAWDAALQSVGGVPRAAQQVSSVLAVLRMVAEGIGIALLPESVRSLRLDDVRYLKVDQLPSSLHYELVVAWNAGNSAPPLKNLISAIRLAGRAS